MSYKCFYCDHEILEEQLHFISFVSMDKEQEETLCSECYREWLEGIKE